MSVVGQRCGQFPFFHYDETGALCKAPTLIAHLQVTLHCFSEEEACLRDNRDLLHSGELGTPRLRRVDIEGRIP